MLGDIIAETTLFAVGDSVATHVAGPEFVTRVVTGFAWRTCRELAFKYFTIVPVRSLAGGKGILLAMRADTIAILAFEIGVFAWMALAHFVFPAPRSIQPNLALFMVHDATVGWFIAYPANIWLLKKRWKEKMSTYPNLEVMESVKLIETQSPGKIA